MKKSQVGIFFYIRGHFVIHGCDLSKAEHHGDFLVYPRGHEDVWRKYYAESHRVEYDYFPRGTVTYRKSTMTFQILYDCCIKDGIEYLLNMYRGDSIMLKFDERYKCHKCRGDM